MTVRPYQSVREFGADYAARLREESCTDPRVPINFAGNRSPQRVERGPTVEEYFARKNRSAPNTRSD